MFSNRINTLLENALDYGITEQEFWNMTFAELERAIESKRRVEKIRAQEKASFDYILAELIGKSIARIYSSSAKMPDIATAYPSLFDKQEIEEKQAAAKAQAFALKLQQFAHAHNTRLQGANNVNE